MSVAREMGVEIVRGVDGPWLDPSQLVVERELVTVADLEQPLNLGTRFDLAICLETAEHLKASAAETLVESLVRHAPAVLFSAAVPYQRGPGHVNEQWPNYWCERFARHRYGALDFIRSSVWYDEKVLWWYRQNVLLFVNSDLCRSRPRLHREGEIQKLRLQPASVVLPDLFVTVARRLLDLEQALLKGGDYVLEVDEHGSVYLTAGDGLTGNGARPHMTASVPRKRAGSAWNVR